MRVIGVIDVMDGKAVRATGGERERYRPAEQAAGRPVRGDAVALARLYLEEFGVAELYVADLDAIGGRVPSTRVVRNIAALGVPVWVDAGVTSVVAAQRCLEYGAAWVVVGLETLPSAEALDEIASAIGASQTAFSLDLRCGRPLAAAGNSIDLGQPEAVARRAAESGVGALILLDLARVGTGAGIDLQLTMRIATAAPQVPLVVGGGIRGRADMLALAQAGCAGALVASALHDGGLTAADVAAIEEAHRRESR